MGLVKCLIVIVSIVILCIIGDGVVVSVNVCCRRFKVFV